MFNTKINFEIKCQTPSGCASRVRLRQQFKDVLFLLYLYLLSNASLADLGNRIDLLEPISSRR